MRERKRKAERIYKEDKEGETTLPVRKTKDIALDHSKTMGDDKPKGARSLGDIGGREDGRELFDFVLKKMSKPDTDK